MDYIFYDLFLAINCWNTTKGQNEVKKGYARAAICALGTFGR